MVQTTTGRTPSAEAEHLARMMFERILTGWAMDVLSLQRRGLDVPGARAASGRPAAPPAEWARAA